jgi:integrase/recombinase XerD
MNLLHSGVDLSTIAIMLGHESVDTTQIYLDADLTVKEQTLNKIAPKTYRMKRFKAKDHLVKYLKSL